MADPRKLPSLEQWAKELAEREAATLNPRPVDSQGVDRISGDPNRGGVASPLPIQQSEGPNNRGDGRRGVEEKGGADSQGDNRLPEPPASVQPPVAEAGASIFASSDNILKTIAQRFKAAREIGKVGAWRQLQSDLMDAMPYVVPIFIPLKDIIQLCADIEKEIKGSTSQAGRSNEEILADFLGGGESLSTIPIPMAPIDYDLKETLDTSDIVGEVNDGDNFSPPIPPPAQP